MSKDFTKGLNQKQTLPKKTAALPGNFDGLDRAFGTGIQAYDDGTISIGISEASPAYLEIPNDATQDEIDNLGHALFTMKKRIQLWIGDYLNTSATMGYGDTKKYAELHGYSVDTLYKWKSITGAVKTFLRRKVWETNRDKKALTISHYELVMSLTAKEQEKYLMRAAENEWSVARLRKDIVEGGIDLPITEKLSPKVRRFKIFQAQVDNMSQAEVLQAIKYLQERLNQ